MSAGGGSNGGPTKASERGLLRLMLRLPALRGRLQILARTSSSLEDLLEAYDDVATTLERLAKEPRAANPSLQKEYDLICSELEAEIIEYCLTHDQDH